MTRSTDPFWDHLFPDDRPAGCDEWCAALHLADEMFRDHPDHEHFDVNDFMIMAAVQRRGQPLLYLYKHIETRRYLNIDTDGVTWRFVAPRRGSSGDGYYVRHRRPADAFDHLELWLGAEMRAARDASRGLGDVVREWADGHE